MIYLDNSATTYPKPTSVVRAVKEAMEKYGANPGRGGNPLSVQASEKVYEAREKTAGFFGAEAERCVFTLNATMASNMAIKGLLGADDHCLISNYEHNAVWRPVYAACRYDVFEVSPREGETAENIRKLRRSNTRCVICTAVSNVSGRIMPIKEICAYAAQNGLVSIVDASQGAGYLPLDVREIGCDILFTSGHKGLYGPFGTGVLILPADCRLKTVIEGGTGTNSLEPVQPISPPERFEAGTVNVCGILGLSAGIDFVKALPDRVSEEIRLTKYLRGQLEKLGAEVCDKVHGFTPVTSFVIPGISPSDIDSELGRAGICVRSGLHCAPLAHKTLGTLDGGTVRVSIGAFTTRSDVDALLGVIKKL